MFIYAIIGRGSLSPRGGTGHNVANNCGNKSSAVGTVEEREIKINNVQILLFTYFDLQFATIWDS